jgi:hypothetical protein
MLDIRKDKEIDPFNLEKEAANQPSQLYDYSKELAQSEKELTHLKNAHKVIVADIMKDCYNNGKTPDGAKATEKAIVAVVDSNEEVNASLSAIADLEYEVKLLKAAVSAIDAKRSMIKVLDNLDARQYYNSTTEGARADQVQDHMNEMLN